MLRNSPWCLALGTYFCSQSTQQVRQTLRRWTGTCSSFRKVLGVGKPGTSSPGGALGIAQHHPQPTPLLCSKGIIGRWVDFVETKSPFLQQLALLPPVTLNWSQCSLCVSSRQVCPQSEVSSRAGQTGEEALPAKAVLIMETGSGLAH